MTLPDVDRLVATYGGALSDAPMPVFNPLTDRSASGMSAALCSVASLSRVATRAFATLFLGTTPIVKSVVGLNDSNWGTSTLPVPGYVSTGIWTLTWPTTVLDQLLQPHALMLRWASAIPTSSAFVNAEVTSANVVTIWAANYLGSLNNFSSSAFVVVSAG